MSNIKVNVPFQVTFKKGFTPYNAICIDNDYGNGADKNLIQRFDNGEVFTVEDAWFNYELTGRKVTYQEKTKYSFFNDGDHIGELEVLSNSTKEEIYELGMQHFFGEAITQSDILLDFEVFEE